MRVNRGEGFIEFTVEDDEGRVAQGLMLGAVCGRYNV